MREDIFVEQTSFNVSHPKSGFSAFSFPSSVSKLPIAIVLDLYIYRSTGENKSCVSCGN